MAYAPQPRRRTREHVRLSWGSSAPPLEITPSRCACAALGTPADWSVLCGYQFRAPDHINVLQLTALTSLVRHLANRGGRRQRILCCVDSRVVLGAVSKGHLVKTSQLRASAFGARVSQRVSLHQFVVGALLGKSCRRAVARHPARQVATFAPDRPPRAPTVLAISQRSQPP